ncbi:uncharacterized protein LOC132046335 [Lycium ferocissimum]|uniref:uncharacterized protein LOC132046335 n=1 Tax=Lycium ferocissimum TaxID=112874 RepID=UPI002815C20E|nr:uncharacterized protein LOC132046335 [Lycium ferocissimum]
MEVDTSNIVHEIASGKGGVSEIPLQNRAATMEADLDTGLTSKPVDATADKSPLVALNIGATDMEESGQQLNSNAIEKAGATPRVGVDASRVDSGQKLIDTVDVNAAENSGQHVLQVENENGTRNWTLVAHKNSGGSRIGSSASQSNSPSRGKGATGNVQLCVDPNLILPTQNVFEPLSGTEKFQLEHCVEKNTTFVQSTNDLIVSEENPGETSRGEFVCKFWIT